MDDRRGGGPGARIVHAADGAALGIGPLRPRARRCKAEGQANLTLTLKDMNGADFKLADQKGKVVLMNFWATWCAPCLAEIPEFMKFYEEKKDKGFIIIGVSPRTRVRTCARSPQRRR